MAGKAHKSLNVFKKPLGLFSKEPMTGFYGNGYCDVGPDDTGNHSVAATLTDPFLDFTASRGNNLRSIGLTVGCKWCLCARRWKEAFDHASQQTDQASESVVPKVHLHATSEKALDVVNMKDLKKYAAEPEVVNASNVAQSRKGGMGGAIKERTELANKEEMTGRE
ncbi:uncharacterized protein K444DRAFT_652262 [Hyaloscypha bicolor E]|uniref:Uncharacterized protein n=1 Tax=Hyaloscypha bicolor E TaxID=1095630 RepID=A0A2J6TEY2_9HELO|nr:uncharacterized protein K444DRAFT_652262 [Hyaloscypha bicolor E]PMD61591.1 hypothetical protein K444DRAFT_652262 [Hyaloscypha bicolor E]